MAVLGVYRRFLNEKWIRWLLSVWTTDRGDIAVLIWQGELKGQRFDWHWKGVFTNGPVDVGLAEFTCRSGRAPFPWLSVRTSFNIRLLTLPFPIAVSHWQAQSQRRHGRGVISYGSRVNFIRPHAGKPKKRGLLSHYFTPWNAKACYCWSTFSICFRFYLSFSLDRCRSQNTSTAHWDSGEGSGECALWNRKHPDIKLHVRIKVMR